MKLEKRKLVIYICMFAWQFRLSLPWATARKERVREERQTQAECSKKNTSSLDATSEEPLT